MYLAGLCGLMLVLIGLYTLIKGGSMDMTVLNIDVAPETVRFGARMAEGLRFGVSWD